MALEFYDRVKETTTSTGTGALSLAGALTGFRSFASVFSSGANVRYALHAVDSGGTPTGEWEVGVGVYSAGTITRAIVIASSSGASAVNLSAGTKHVWCGMDAQQARWIRERLSSDMNYYVSPSGSNSNSGLVVGSPFLTIAFALSVIKELDCGGKNVAIQLAAGTYAESIEVPRFVNCQNLSIFGDPSGSGDTSIISSTNPFVSYSEKTTYIYLANFAMSLLSGGSTHVNVSEGSRTGLSNIFFKGVSATNAHIFSDKWATVDVGMCTVECAANAHLRAQNNGFISVWHEDEDVTTISGSPAFADAFAVAATHGLIDTSLAIFSGTATGKRYATSLCGVVNNTGGATLPGSIAGTTASGGQYA